MRLVFVIMFLCPSVFAKELADSGKIQFILDELVSLKNMTKTCDNKVKELGEEKIRKDGEVKEHLAALETQVAELREKIQRLESVKQGTESTKTDQHEVGKMWESKNNTFSSIPYTTLNRNAMSYVTRVAFTAAVHVTTLDGLGSHHTIIFDRTLSNIGNAYNPQTGVFTAPVKGVYVFSVTLMAKPKHRQYLEIVIDGIARNDILASARDTNDYNSTHKQWIFEVNKGAEVWIRTKGSTFGKPQVVHGNMHTSFSGFLLYEME